MLHCIPVKVYVVMLQLSYIKLLGINVQVVSHLEHWCRLLIVAVLSQQLKCNTAPNPLGFSIASPCIPSLWVTINENQPIQILLVISPIALRDCFHHVFWVLCTTQHSRNPLRVCCSEGKRSTVTFCSAYIYYTS